MILLFLRLFQRFRDTERQLRDHELARVKLEDSNNSLRLKLDAAQEQISLLNKDLLAEAHRMTDWMARVYRMPSVYGTELPAEPKIDPGEPVRGGSVHARRVVDQGYVEFEKAMDDEMAQFYKEETVEVSGAGK